MTVGAVRVYERQGLIEVPECRVPSPGLLQGQASKNGAHRYNNVAYRHYFYTQAICSLYTQH